jgi:hypothetical protein
VTRDRAGKDGSGALRSQHAETTVSDESSGGGLEGLSRLVDDFEDAVTDDDIGAALVDGLEQGRGIAEDSPDRVGDPGLRGTTLERRECVGTGVDDDDLMTEPGDSDGKSAGASTEVDDVQRPVGTDDPPTCLEHRLQGVEHHRTADRAALTLHHGRPPVQVTVGIPTCRSLNPSSADLSDTGVGRAT